MSAAHFICPVTRRVGVVLLMLPVGQSPSLQPRSGGDPAVVLGTRCPGVLVLRTGEWATQRFSADSGGPAP